jgi:ribosomal protein S18 acetylase RimI-like enzyme
MGTVAMLLTEPSLDDAELVRLLCVEAERYLRRRGASVFYMGGQFPLNPFYWGIYAGSEFSGVLDSHASFIRAATRVGYEPVASTVLLEADLNQPEPRDARAFMLRRLYRTEVSEDAMTVGWWEAQAIGLFRPSAYRLANRETDQIVAHATTWDFAGGAGVGDGRSRLCLTDLEVDPEHRRKGLGRYLVAEILRNGRSQMNDVICAQTSVTNEAALSLYNSLGFEQVDTSTLFRLPAELATRSLENAESV